MKGYRTYIWNLLNAVPVVMSLVESQYAIPDEWEPFWLAAFIIVNLWLRTITTTPPGQSEDD